ncbi:MAG: hypothetical protein ACK4RK_12615 [Gemmataceae bacterium]
MRDLWIGVSLVVLLGIGLLVVSKFFEITSHPASNATEKALLQAQVQEANAKTAKAEKDLKQAQADLKKLQDENAALKMKIAELEKQLADKGN